RLSKLLITPGSPAGALEIRRDGKPVDRGLWGTAVPVDPGEHRIEARAPGKQAWRRTVVVAAAPETTTVPMPGLADEPPAPERTAPFVPIPRSPSRSIVPGVALAGVAAAGIGAGVALFVAGAGKRSDAQAKAAQIVAAHRSCIPGAANFFDAAACG